MKPIARNRSLTQIATEELREAIVNGSLALGELLSENHLAEVLNISRTPVREALMQLRKEGLVKAGPKGSTVFTLSAKETKELSQYRFGLESFALKAAIENDCAGYIDALRRLIVKMSSAQQAGDIQKYLLFDSQFHASVFDFCDNQYLVEAYQLISAKISALRNYLLDVNDLTAQTLKDHKAIVKAVEQRDTELAISILDEHINSVNNYFSMSMLDITKPNSVTN